MFDRVLNTPPAMMPFVRYKIVKILTPDSHKDCLLISLPILNELIPRFFDRVLNTPLAMIPFVRYKIVKILTPDSLKDCLLISLPILNELIPRFSDDFRGNVS